MHRNALYQAGGSTIANCCQIVGGFGSTEERFDVHWEQALGSGSWGTGGIIATTDYDLRLSSNNWIDAVNFCSEVVIAIADRDAGAFLVQNWQGGNVSFGGGISANVTLDADGVGTLTLRGWDSGTPSSSMRIGKHVHKDSEVFNYLTGKIKITVDPDAGLASAEFIHDFNPYAISYPYVVIDYTPDPDHPIRWGCGVNVNAGEVEVELQAPKIYSADDPCPACFIDCAGLAAVLRESITVTVDGFDTADTGCGCRRDYNGEYELEFIGILTDAASNRTGCCYEAPIVDSYTFEAGGHTYTCFTRFRVFFYYDDGAEEYRALFVFDSCASYAETSYSDCSGDLGSPVYSFSAVYSMPSPYELGDLVDFTDVCLVGDEPSFEIS